MKIEIKKSKKPVIYENALKFMENRLRDLNKNKARELIWILEHDEVYTAGTSYQESEILDKSINIIKTNRGGKITWHGPGQIICYFVIDLNKRNRDIRKFISLIENVIIQTLTDYKIKSFADRKNIGIWVKKNKVTNKVAALGLRIKKWIVYHGFSLNVKNDLKPYSNIIPCGIRDKGVTNLKQIKINSYKDLRKKIIYNLKMNLEI